MKDSALGRVRRLRTEASPRVKKPGASRSQEMSKLSSTSAARTTSELVASLRDARDRLERTAASISARLRQDRHELDAKVGALERQPADAPSTARRRIERRILTLRDGYGERRERLERAYLVARGATRPQLALRRVRP
jgi:hypothetical protein